MFDPGITVDGGNGPTAVGTELSAAMIENQDWLAALEEQGTGTSEAQVREGEIPVGIDGTGMLVLDLAGSRCYAKAATLHVDAAGRLRDTFGRAVMGVASAGGDSRLSPLRLAAGELSRFERFDLDTHGVWYGVTVVRAGRRGLSTKRVALGRLAFAIFDAPETLRPLGDGAFERTTTAGAVRYFSGDAPNVGSVRRNPQRPAIEDLRANLRALWSLSGRAEIEVALATSRDALARAALNLVR